MENNGKHFIKTIHEEVLYVSNLLEVTDTSQQILDDFNKGVFKIKKSPVNLTLKGTKC